MGGQGIPDEVHPDYDEFLLVVDGQLELIIDEIPTTLHRGEYITIPAGATHRISPGSDGILLLVDTDTE